MSEKKTDNQGQDTAPVTGTDAATQDAAGKPTATAGEAGKQTATAGEAGNTETRKKAPVVVITERAAKEVARVIEDNNMPAETYVRIGAKGGGCSGMTYVLDFDQTGPTEFDLTFEEHGVKVVIDKKSSFFMAGTVLDFNDGLLNRGFVFNNPTATGTCGCGTSFST